MKLKGFQVTNYKSILDSGWIDIDNITAIVGKNESGKTALLHALNKLNPFTNETYSFDQEWPRGHRRTQFPDAVVVQAYFEFQPNEQRQLAKISPDTKSFTGVKIDKCYDGTCKFKFLPDDNKVLSGTNTSLADLLQQLRGNSSSSRNLRRTLLQIRQEIQDTFSKLETAEFEHSVSDYISQIDSASSTRDKIRVKQAEDTLQQLLEYKKVETLRNRLEAVTADWIPTFIYMDEHKPFRGSAFLDQIASRQSGGQLTEEDNTFLMILKMAGLDFNTEHARSTSQDKETRMLDMNDASVTITNLMASHWTQREYKIRFQADGYHIVTFVSDEVQSALVSLEERSKGFQWFFSFDAMFLHKTNGTFKDAVILLDEPGLHLHASAQHDLLLRLQEYAKNCQLIYTTHMPFMIDTKRLDNIRVCLEDKERGTTVSSDLYSENEQARFPFQAALGLSMSQSLFVGAHNLVVEGVTDFWLLSTMSTILQSAGRESLDDQIVITPCGGASKAAYVATMLFGQRLDVVVLLDSDSAGKSAAKELINKWILKDQNILLIGQILQGGHSTMLEDLVPNEFYLKYVNEVFQKEFEDSPIMLEDIGSQGHIVQRIENAFLARGLSQNSEGKAFNKGRIARKMLLELPKLEFDELPSQLVENFEQLFVCVNEKMPGLQ